MVSAYPNLALGLKNSNIPDAMLASLLNIPENTLSLKMMGVLPWTLTEAINICIVLNNPDVYFLFSS